MNKFTFLSMKHFSPGFKLNVSFWVFIIILAQLPVLAQDFTSISWGTAASQPASTHEVHGDVVNGKLYIFGGYDVNKLPSYSPTKRAFVYNPVTNQWASIADLPHNPNGSGFGGITHVGLTTDGTNIYFAGGYPSNSTGTGQTFGTREVWKYNVASNTYTRLPDLPQQLAGGQLRYLNGRIHYLGGTNISRADVGVHYVLNLSNLTAGWTTLASLSDPRNHAGSAVYGGKIYSIGGSHHQDASAITQKTVEIYNPATNTWTRGADLPVARDHISSAVVVIGSRVLVLGGETSHNVTSRLVSAYSPASNSWTALTQLPASKAAGVAAVLNGNIHYTGGNFGKTNYKGIPAGGGTQASTLLPVADAFVRNGSFAATNYGKDTALIVKSSTASGYTRTSYLKFSLSSLNNISSAKLRIYGRNVENTTAISLSAFEINTDSWTETALTFNNAPAATAAALGSVAVNNVAKYYEIDVTNYVKTQFAGDKIVSFLIKDAANQNRNLTFHSKEHANNKPQLVVISSLTVSNSVPGNSLESENDSRTPLVYPNPVEKRFNLIFPEHHAGDFSLDIVDQFGRIYSIGKVSVPHGGSDIDVDVSKFLLRPGVYFLRISSVAGSEKIKLILR